MLTKVNEELENLHDCIIQDQFENWLIDSGIKVRFNTATYFIDFVTEDITNPILKLFGFRKKKIILTLHVVTNRPGFLIGEAGSIINKYKKIFSEIGIDIIKIHEVKDQGVLHRCVNRKIKQ